MSNPALPTIIQGGMGAGVSNWRLARAVSRTGQLGVVSGTALDVILARRLQVGDPGGHMRRALAHFPVPRIAGQIIDRYFRPDGLGDDSAFRAKPMPALEPSRAALDLLVAASFVEVFLAREGHDHGVGINFLEKIQLPTLPALYGAMLAGVAFVLVGAGIPRAIPGIMDRLAEHLPVTMPVDLKGSAPAEAPIASFDPAPYAEHIEGHLDRPDFIAIVSSSTLASVLKRKASGRVDGFIVEHATAGGHNAPPRRPIQMTVGGEPIYTERDTPDLQAIAQLGLPFWLAGGFGSPEQLAAAIDAGARGIQVGTAFACCEESGLAPAIKQQIIEASIEGRTSVFTDPVASPTGFPFKVMQLPETLSDAAQYEQRDRVCDLGYLRHAYVGADGAIGWRCPAEPVDDYVRKGGDVEETIGRKCLCNALMANIDLAQARRDGATEQPLVTIGDDVASVRQFLEGDATSYTAADVIRSLTARRGGGHVTVVPTTVWRDATSQRT
jgi:nitronate monooxygenase